MLLVHDADRDPRTARELTYLIYDRCQAFQMTYEFLHIRRRQQNSWFRARSLSLSNLLWRQKANARNDIASLSNQAGRSGPRQIRRPSVSIGVAAAVAAAAVGAENRTRRGRLEILPPHFKK